MTSTPPAPGGASAVEWIGVVHNGVTAPVDEGWGRVVSEIVLDEMLADGLDGIEAFSHVLVLFWMHRAAEAEPVRMRRRPQGREDMPEVGIFAQRARHRPNPIGATAVELLWREKNRLVVRGLDAIDGTPVVDVKPYVPKFDSIDSPRVPAWMNRLMERYF
jgi:tRNA-Thr(GGU) m(6)t(6)A37 methyltransferase TsaA